MSKPAIKSAERAVEGAIRAIKTHSDWAASLMTDRYHEIAVKYRYTNSDNADQLYLNQLKQLVGESKNHG